jgi:hypothetical protein
MPQSGRKLSLTLTLSLVKGEATHTHEVKHLEERRVWSDMKETV